MGKMKALLIDKEEDNQEFDVVMEEAHYHHVINDFVSLIDEHGWPKVIGDVRAKLVARDWWSPW